MKMGIYKLFWKEDINNFYIGLSQSIENRYKKHCKDLINNTHCNHKMGGMYIKYGTLPIYEIIEECSIDNLNTREEYWINTYNTIENGLNIVEGGKSGYGINSAYSKYSKIQVLIVFRLLSNTRLQYNEIANITKVNKSTVASIARGDSHLWLRAKYRYHYDKLLNRKRKAYFISPKGILVEVTNLAEFSRENNLISTAVNDLLMGRRKSHKGWVLKNSSKEMYFTNGIETILVTNLAEFAKFRNLDKNCLSKIKRGIQKTHKGWRLAHQKN